LIIQYLFLLLSSLITAIIAKFPTFQLPSWGWEALTYWNGLFSNLYKLNGFVPITAILQVTLFIMLAIFINWTIKIIRISYSMITGGGGAT
jgi:hypothetical protein